MKKVLNKDLTLFFEKFYPCKRMKLGKRHKVLVSIGGNVGDVKFRFKKLFNKIQKDKRVNIVKTSPILKNPPFGFKEQNYFYNAVILLETDMYIKEFFKYIMYLENFFKRERLFKNAPRTLDIDIIFFDKITYNKNNLQIPHAMWQSRESVLIPLIFLKD